MSVNPYTPPKAALEARPAGQYWRDGKVVVTRNGAVLPARCVRCNEAASTQLKRKVYWHHPAWYLLILINIILYAIVALIIRKRAEVSYGICQPHLRRRQAFLAIGWGGFVLGLLMIFSGGATAMLGIFVVLLSIVAGFAGARLAYAARITPEEVRLNGCGTAFVESLPSATEAASEQRAMLPAGSGTCPNCEAVIPMDSKECPRCKALFGGESAWRVQPAAP